jgi:subtilisin family serine protease
MRIFVCSVVYFFVGFFGASSYCQEIKTPHYYDALASNEGGHRIDSNAGTQPQSQNEDQAIELDKRPMNSGEKSYTTIDRSPSFVERVFGGIAAVNELRQFRDQLLGKSPEGRAYIDLVYDIMPDLALVMIRNSDVRSRTSENINNIVSLVPSSLEKEIIEPEIGEILNKILDDFANAKEASDYLINEIQRMKEERPIVPFIFRFNRTNFERPSEKEIKHLTPHSNKYRPDTILVKFKSGTPSSKIKQICNGVGIVVQKQFRRVTVYKMRVPENKVMETIEKLLKYDEVQYAEPDYILKIIQRLPNDSDFDKLWGMNNTGQDGGTVDADIDAPEAWEINIGSNEVVVCVIDTGVNYDHEDLSSNMWVNNGEIPNNGIDDDGNGYVDDYLGWDFCNVDEDPMDDHDHGTHCSGTIGGIGNNKVGVAGVNWTVKIMPLKFLDSCGSGYTSDAVEAIIYSTMMGAVISSNSWGGADFSQALFDAIEDFGNSGGVFIAAAGNGDEDGIGIDNDEDPHYPSSYDLPNIIAVAATDRDDHLADFSNYGVESVDVAAPGVDIYSTVISGYSTFSGTSMATPHVAGVAALVKSQNLSAGYAVIRAAIQQGVETKASLIGKIATDGRINAYRALRSFKQCPDCPADGLITNATYHKGTTCSCSNPTCIMLGENVTVEGGATVTFTAPTITVQPGFYAENGSVVHMKE